MNDRPKNYAKKEEEGYYTVFVKNNKVVVTKHKENSPRPLNAADKQEIVRCHPDDKFNIGEAINIAVDRLCEDDIIRIGDTVKVIRSGRSMSAKTTWPKQYNEYALQYRFGVCPEDGLVAEVVGINGDEYIIQTAKQPYLGNENFTCLDCYGSVYVIQTGGLKKIKSGGRKQ